LGRGVINSAAYILNRTGTNPDKGKTPYKTFFEKSINLYEFKAFGSRVTILKFQKRNA